MKYTMIILILFLIIKSTLAGTLTDDFSDGNMNEWTKEGVVKWRIDNGELIIESGSFGGFGIGEITWKDYTVSVSLKIVEHQPTIGWVQAAAIGLRGINLYNGYRFALGTLGMSPKQIQTYYVKTPRNFVQHFVSKPFKWELNKWYDLKSTVEGNLFKYYVNGELIFEYTDNTFPTGKVGIGVGNSKVAAHFKNFVVTGDDVPDLNLSVSPKGKLPNMWGKIKKL